jgi:rod shape-determining protein MreD
MRINKRFIIKSVVYALIAVVLMTLETSVLNGLRIFGAKPNLIISLVVAAAVVENERYAAVLGMICGFVVDSSVGSPFSFSGIYYFFAAYMASLISRFYFTKSFFTMIIMILPVCFVRGIFNLFFLIGVWGDFHIGEALLLYILPEYLYTIALAPAVYFLVRLSAGRISYNVTGN